MIKFGTSGFRGIIGDNWTKKNIQKIGFAFRQMLETEAAQSADSRKVQIAAGGTDSAASPIKIIVGYDNRFMGKESAQWFCEAVGCDLIKLTVFNKPVPTPALAFKVVDKFDYGVMFTASHNPYFYNGIKVVLKGGKEADDTFFTKVAKNIENLKNPKETAFNDLTAQGLVTWTDDVSDYIEKVASLLDAKKIQDSGIKISFNAMHGSSTEVVNAIFNKAGIKYEIMNGNADPYFGGLVPAPYGYNLKAQVKHVVKHKFSFGFALDGDGDRVTFIDADGKIYDCNYLLAIFYYYFVEIKKRKGSIVKNFLSSNLSVRLCKKYGFGAYETRVGFKFLGSELERTDSFMAGEATGIAFKDISLYKDGIFAAFLLIDVIASMKKNIGKIVEEIIDLVTFPTCYMEFPYVFEEQARAAIEKRILSEKTELKFDYEIKKIDRYPDGLKIHFEDDYWCAARMSGTETVVRLYTEMQCEADAEAVIKKLENIYGLHQRQS